MMPWNYFEIEDGQLTAKKEISSITVFNQLAADTDYLEYIKKYYTHGSSNSYREENDDDYYQVPVLNEIPPNLYTLATIVCHMGTLNRGHYYSLVNKIYYKSGNIIFDLWEANDE